MTGLKRSARLAPRILVVAALLATLGCSTQSGRLGYDDGSDVCRPQRVALDSTGDFFAQDIIGGAAIGAVGGGLLGLAAGRDLRSVAIGAVSGAAVGAIGGYFKARQDQIADQAVLYRTMSSDISRDNENIDKTQLAFNQLVDCRQREAERVRADLRAGRVARPQAEVAMAAVRQRSAEDLRMAQTISTQISGRSADFEFANAQVNPGTTTTPPAAGPRRPTPARPANAGPRPVAPEVQTATVTNLAKQDRFRASVAAAQSDQSKFELS